MLFDLMNKSFVFFGNNLLYSAAVVVVSFLLAWFLYSKVVLKGINLKEALFEKDNLAGWIEFIGAFMLPLLYLGAKAAEGSVNSILWQDLLISLGYVVAYSSLFTILRLLTNVFVKFVAPSDEEGKICLNNEIYKQKNVSASIFSATASLIFVNVLNKLNFSSTYEAFHSILVGADTLAYSLIAIIVYFMFQKGKTSIFKEIFVDNNLAASALLIGFVFATQSVLTSAYKVITSIDTNDYIILCLGYLLVFAIISWLTRALFERILKVSCDEEIFVQNNLGCAIGVSALYIGIAFVIGNFAII